MNRNWIIVLLTGFVAGVLLRSFIDSGWLGAGFFVFLGVVMVAIAFLSENRKFVLLISLFLIAVGLGIARYEIKDIKGDFLAFEQNLNQRVIIEGIVADEPEEKEKYTRLIIKSNDAGILVYTEHYPEFHYGDKIEIEGILKRPRNLNEEFDWKAYLAKDEIYYEIFYPKIKFSSAGHGFWIKEKLFALKNNFISALSQVIPEPHSAFMAGLTVGAKRSIPKDLLEDFRKTGIIHIVVLSGYNITLVADTVMRALSFLPKILGTSLGILGIILFTIMTGASAATVRAAMMAVLVVWARTTGRIYTITWALFLTGFLMVLHNPKILVFDTGFQLSFLATFALIYLAPYFEKKFLFIPKKFKLREIASATVSTQIFVLPLLLYKMGLFSLVSLPVNLLVLIFVPVTMFFGFLTGGLGMASNILSTPFGWIGYAFLQYELRVVDFFAKLPFSSFTIKNFPFWLTLFVYIIYSVIIYRINAKKKKPI